jgi:hypothetical protein
MAIDPRFAGPRRAWSDGRGIRARPARDGTPRSCGISRNSPACREDSLDLPHPDAIVLCHLLKAHAMRGQRADASMVGCRYLRQPQRAPSTFGLWSGNGRRCVMPFGRRRLRARNLGHGKDAGRTAGPFIRYGRRSWDGIRNGVILGWRLWSEERLGRFTSATRLLTVMTTASVLPISWHEFPPDNYDVNSNPADGRPADNTRIYDRSWVCGRRRARRQDHRQLHTATAPRINECRRGLAPACSVLPGGARR